MKLSESRVVIIEKNISTGHALVDVKPCPSYVSLWYIENKIKVEKRFGKNDNNGCMSTTFKNIFITMSVKKILEENGYVLLQSEEPFENHTYIFWKNI